MKGTDIPVQKYRSFSWRMHSQEGYDLGPHVLPYI